MIYLTKGDYWSLLLNIHCWCHNAAILHAMFFSAVALFWLDAAPHKGNVTFGFRFSLLESRSYIDEMCESET